MSSFKKVEVLKAANIYFEGKVTSRVVYFADGSKKTLGIMLPGEYEFSTDERELVDIQTGEMRVLLPEATEWKTVTQGMSFAVPKNSSFKVKVKSVTDYCCSYY